MSDQQHLAGLIQEMERARAEAQSTTRPAAEPSRTRKGKILTEHGDGRHEVQVISESGSLVEVIDNIRALGGVSLPVDTQVSLSWFGMNPIPEIDSVTSGGGSTVTQTAVTGFLGFLREG